MQFAVLVHPRDMEQARCFYPWLRRVPDSVIARFLPCLPLLTIGNINVQPGIKGAIIACPLLMLHFEQLAPDFIWRKIIAGIKKAGKRGAIAVGLEGRTACLTEAGAMEDDFPGLAISIGARIRIHALINGARSTAAELGLRWNRTEIVLAGALGQEGRIWAQILAAQAGTLTLLHTEAGKDQRFISKIVYETGLAPKISTDFQQTLGRADIVFFHHLKPENKKIFRFFKPGALVVSIIPENGWQDIQNYRKDIKYLENLLFEPLPTITWSGYGDFTKGFSAAIVETILIILEKSQEFFCPGQEITINQVKLTEELMSKYGFRLMNKSAYNNHKGSRGLSTVYP